MDDSLARINGYLDYVFAYGPFWVYLVILLACFVENLFPPFPGDSFIVVGGALAAAGRLNAPLTFLTVIIGGMSSVGILYVVGRRYGRDFFMRKDYKYFSADDILKVETKFARWGALVLITSRFAVGLRAVLAIVAGIGRYPAPKMLVFSTVSYILFTGLIMYLAGRLMANLDRVGYYFRTYDAIVWPILVLLVVLYIGRKYFILRKQS
jgi:membrane protein DedA with SNARE-associated domain